MTHILILDDIPKMEELDEVMQLSSEYLNDPMKRWISLLANMSGTCCFITSCSYSFLSACHSVFDWLV